PSLLISYSTLYLISSPHHFFFFYCSGAPRALHSFPTRRSSDLCTFAARSFIGQVLRRDVVRQLAVVQHQHALPHPLDQAQVVAGDRKSTRLNSSHVKISYAVFCLKKKKKKKRSAEIYTHESIIV